MSGARVPRQNGARRAAREALFASRSLSQRVVHRQGACLGHSYPGVVLVSLGRAARMEAELEEQARRVLERCRGEGLRLALVEACAGGLISASLTAIPGSSAVVEVGLVPYSNESKQELLGVPRVLLEAHGAVSAEVAGAMAQGVLARSRADVALAETGIAGPGGATPAKPVGLVFLAMARRGGELSVERHVFPGDRRTVRIAAAARGLALLLEKLGS